MKKLSANQTSPDADQLPKAQKVQPDGTKFFSTFQLSMRWGQHIETVREAVRARRIESVRISRHVLVPVSEVERIENEGRIQRAA